jgi:hypothetical protein
MRTVSVFKLKGRKVHIYEHHSIGPKGQTFYRATLDGEDLPVDWPNAAELELAIKKLPDETP